MLFRSAAGAFGAHALQGRIDAGMTAIFETGAHYHLIHALATVAAALAAHHIPGKSPALSAALFTAGTLLFSGSLYFLALTGSYALVLVTPLGGLAFLAGWVALAFGALKRE